MAQKQRYTYFSRKSYSYLRKAIYIPPVLLLAACNTQYGSTAPYLQQDPQIEASQNAPEKGEAALQYLYDSAKQAEAEGNNEAAIPIYRHLVGQKYKPA